MQALERTIGGFQTISGRGYKKKNKVFRRLATKRATSRDKI